MAITGVALNERATNSQNRTTLQAASNKLHEAIRAEIAAGGAMPFDRFMQLALHCPEYGFYEKESDIVGRSGDFYTSVSVGKLFGELLAFQFARWLEELETRDSKRGTKLRIVESGAHNGQLAKDILTWLRERRPETFGGVECWIVEPSQRLRARQAGTLAEFSDKVHWTSSVSALGKVRGVIYSNELLDAMPAKRFGWDAKRREWFEWGVGCGDSGFQWSSLGKTSDVPLIQSQFPDLTGQLLEVLPDGFIVEILSAASQWWADTATVLEAGRLLTFDYGGSDSELLMPERASGTLRAYREHRLSSDVLASPGEQDITAHVNFSVIQAAGEAAGLKTERFDSQAKFLTEVASAAWDGDSGLGGWTPQHTRQFQTLTHPDHLGRSFRVLVQYR